MVRHSFFNFRFNDFLRFFVMAVWYSCIFKVSLSNLLLFTWLFKAILWFHCTERGYCEGSFWISNTYWPEKNSYLAIQNAEEVVQRQNMEHALKGWQQTEEEIYRMRRRKIYDQNKNYFIMNIFIESIRDVCTVIFKEL